MSERIVHCWEGGPMVEQEDGGLGSSSTCMLLDGHTGPHEFTPDKEIVVRFFE